MRQFFERHGGSVESGSMRMRTRLGIEQLLDSEAGLAVCDLLAQSNIEPRAVPRELLQELLAAEYLRRRELAPAQTRNRSRPCILSLGCDRRPQ
jgi:hypothetical protein